MLNEGPSIDTTLYPKNHAGLLVGREPGKISQDSCDRVTLEGMGTSRLGLTNYGTVQ
jgi:hypothetical protein